MKLREAAQQALEALEKLVVGSEYEEAVEAERAIYALRAALAAPGSDYERGFVDGMLEQARRSVDKAVNAMAKPIIKPEIKEDKPFGYFRAEPFGWTDCAPTDEGAIPLYERPQGKLLPWKGLTEEEVTYYKACGFVGVKAVEEKLRARNSTLACHQGEEGK